MSWNSFCLQSTCREWRGLVAALVCVVLPDACGQPLPSRPEIVEGKHFPLLALDPKRFGVLGMSTDRDERLASEFLLRNGISFANFFHENARHSHEWGMRAHPETFLIALDGMLVRRIVGFREWDSPQILAELETLYPGGMNQGKAGTKEYVK